MLRNLALIVILAVLSYTASARKWHGYHPYHSHPYHSDPYGRFASSSSEEDWAYYSGYNNPYRQEPFSFRNNLHHPFSNWGGHGGLGYNGGTSVTTSTVTPVVDTDSCLASCPNRAEYQPVCGTDYQTYDNLQRLLCAQRCGADVRIFLWRSCPSLGLGLKRSTKVQCITTCDLTEEKNQVCGSDDITYDNLSKLLCAQKCGYNVTLKAMAACTVEFATKAPNLGRNSIPFNVRSCMQSCPTTPENNPVCGTNDVTYRNPSYLDCARICGIDVELKQRSPCGQTNNANSNPSVNDQNLNPLSTAVQACLESCPMTSELNPVCGSNGITYPNPSQLECDISCGIKVNLVQRSPCPGGNNNDQGTTSSPLTTTTISARDAQACISGCPQTPEYNPVCGTNGVTYNNFGHLTCAQACGVRVDVRSRSKCSPRPKTTDTPTTSELLTPINAQQTGSQGIDINGGFESISGGNNGVNVVTNRPAQMPGNNVNNPLPNKDDNTISPELLLNVFMDATTMKSTSTTEPDEETDFDTRFGDRLV